MAKIEEPTIEVKLFVDKEKKKVLFAESDKEFVDVLFSFLTMPLGTIVRLLGKQSQMGCLDEVYKSVEDLSTDFFQTKACKGMLLAPLNAASSHCSRLKINVDDTKVRTVYVCRDESCLAHRDNAFSSVRDTVCKCGKVMKSVGESPQNDVSTAAGESEDGIFVKGCLKFIITDDFHVAPASTSLMLSLFEKFGVRDPIDLEKEVVNLSLDKISNLLKRSLTSKQPFTGYYFDVSTPPEDTSLDMLPQNLHEQANKAEHKDKVDGVKIKVLQEKNNSSLLCAEVGDDFVDLLFGLLSIPLGYMIKTFGQGYSKGCLDNLYSSINGSAKGCMKPECQSLLLAPRAWPFFGSGATKILQVEESAPNKVQVNSCFKCLKFSGFSTASINCHKKDHFGKIYCFCNEVIKSSKLCELNPKSPSGGGGQGDAYVKGGHMKFMVTDGLRVLPFALSTTVQVLSDAKIKTNELVENEMSLSKFQVMEIQRASLMSQNALSFVLLRPKKKRKAES
ncbi:unnamed protein product [Urochloa humidicola]